MLTWKSPLISIASRKVGYNKGVCPAFWMLFTVITGELGLHDNYKGGGSGNSPSNRGLLRCVDYKVTKSFLLDSSERDDSHSRHTNYT